MTAHLRMNAVYWGLTALCIMKHKDALDAEETIEYVMSCWDDEAGAHESSTYNLSPPPSPPHDPRNSKATNSGLQKVHSAHTRATTRTSSPH